MRVLASRHHSTSDDDQLRCGSGEEASTHGSTRPSTHVITATKQHFHESTPPSVRNATKATNVSLRDRLIGAWTLVEYSAHSPTNADDRIWPMGKHAQGIIMYTPDGYMSAQLQTPGVAAFEPPGTEGQWAEVGRRYIAYTGRFFLDEQGDAKGPILVHEMRNSNLPRLVGDRQRRLCEVKDESDGRYLYLSVDAPMTMGGAERIPYVRWKRLDVNEETREPGARL